jgi:hypothetical protein
MSDTSTQFPPAAIRAAILDTARLFETRPGLWDFWHNSTPDCGSPGCALGYIAFHLGVKSGDVQDEFCPLVLGIDVSKFYADLRFSLDGKTVLSEMSIEQVVRALRAYADKFYPAEQLDPAFASFKRSLAGLAGLAASYRLEGKHQLAAIVADHAEQDGAL